MFQQQYDAFEAFRVLARAVAVAEDAFPFQVAVFQRAQVVQEDGYAAFGAYYNLAQVVQSFYQSDATYHVAQVTTVQHAAAHVGVVVLDGFYHLGERQVILFQLPRVYFHLELGGDTTEIGYVGYAGYFLDAGDDYPVLQVGEFAQRVLVALYQVAVNFADGRGQRVKSGHGAVGEFHFVQSFLHTLAAPVILGSVFEDDGYHG